MNNLPITIGTHNGNDVVLTICTLHGTNEQDVSVYYWEAKEVTPEGFTKQYFSNGSTVPFAETNSDPIPVILQMIQNGLPLPETT